MKARIQHAWLAIRESFWFIPLVMSLASAALSWGMLWLDTTIGWQRMALGVSSLYRGSAAGAQALLSTIAGSMVGVAGTVFSITIAVLSFSSSTFGARLLRNFMRDRGTQMTLGIYVSTYVYCLMILRVIQSAAQDTEVPHASVNAGILLAILCLAALIYFIHHVASMIQTPHVLATVARDLDRAIDDRMPFDIERSILAQDSGVAQTMSRLLDDAVRIVARSSGYLQSVDEAGLLRLATEHKLRIWLERSLGDFCIEGHTVAYVWAEDDLPEKIEREINDAMIIGAHIASTQGIVYPLNQLVEIALRALSPGINDPFTAMSCLDWLGAALYQIAERETPSPYHHDRLGYVRLVTRPLGFEQLVGMAFDQIRQAGNDNVAISRKLLETLGVLLSHVTKDAHVQVLWRQVEATHRGISASGQDACDQDELVALYETIQRTYQERRN